MGRRILVHALIIARTDGMFLSHIIRNPSMDEAVLSGFISALNMFGKETLGSIDDISISGLDMHLIVVRKWGLMCIGIIDSDLPEFNFREGCENALETFYQRYINQIENWNGSLKPFAEFRNYLEDQIQGYFEKLKEYRTENKDLSEDRLNIDQGKQQEEIWVLKNDIYVFQEANKNLHKKIKNLEEENKSLKDRVQRFLNGDS